MAQLPDHPPKWYFSKTLGQGLSIEYWFILVGGLIRVALAITHKGANTLPKLLLEFEFRYAPG